MKARGSGVAGRLAAMVALVGCACGSGAGGEPDAAVLDPVIADASGTCGGGAQFFFDRDEDGFGDPATPSCTSRPGYVEDSTDCDDSDENRNPGETELCNTIDDDCDGEADNGACIEGCADGEREGFVDGAMFPTIAGCAGAFAVPGLVPPVVATCGRVAGDDGDIADGTGCAAEDLCQPGWHVCASPADVMSSSPSGCASAVEAGAPLLFFATGQSGPGDFQCGAGDDDLFGCGNLGTGVAASCSPLTRSSNNLCGGLGAPWACGGDNSRERINVTKSAADRGGVLCCRD